MIEIGGRQQIVEGGNKSPRSRKAELTQDDFGHRRGVLGDSTTTNKEHIRLSDAVDAVRTNRVRFSPGEGHAKESQPCHSPSLFGTAEE